MFNRNLYKRVVIALDPALTCNRKSDETGIIIVGLGKDNCGYVLDDVSGKYPPHEWSRLVARLYKDYKADQVIIEANAGGDMVGYILRIIDPYIRIKNVRATTNKAIRALPVAFLYTEKRVYHCQPFEKLETQMCTYRLQDNGKSPDRVDALVWALTELMLRPSIPKPKIWIP